MPNQLANSKKWLGAVMIVLGVVIYAVSLSGQGPAFYGPFMRDMYGHSQHRYGHHLMGRGSMPPGWLGRQEMPYSGYIMPGPDMVSGLGAVHLLDLSKQQQQRIAALSEEIGEERQALLDQLSAQTRALNALLLSDAADSGALTQKFMQCSELRRQLFEAALEERQRLDDILTAEQRGRLLRWQREHLKHRSLY